MKHVKFRMQMSVSRQCQCGKAPTITQ